MIVKHCPSRPRVIAFVSSQAVILFAFYSPLSEISTTLFSAHMLQHVLLILVAAPLFAYSSPFRLLLFALPHRPRQAINAWCVNASRLHWVSALRTKSWIAWAVFAGMLWVWHLPSLYQLAVESSAVHALEHFGLFGSSAFFWWTLTRNRNDSRAALGPSVFYVLTMAVHTGVLGALFSFASAPVYPIYSFVTPMPGWRPLDDQQIAGLIMWIVGASTFVAAACALFLEWLNGVEDGVREKERQAKLQEESLRGTKTGNAHSSVLRPDL